MPRLASSGSANWLAHCSFKCQTGRWQVRSKLSRTRTPYEADGKVSGNYPPSRGTLEISVTGDIPPELGNLTNLQYLYLYSNQLSDSIPAELGSLTNLQYLWLSNNQLSGSIPTELGNLTNLQYLNLSSNQLTGSIPLELGNLIDLIYLNLSSNQLAGSIPTELGNLASLRTLYLYNNQLSGSIPPQLGDLINLEDLRLNSNQFSGALPGTLTNLVNLDTFWFHDTDLCEPADAAFQIWLASISDLRSTGVICPGPGLPYTRIQIPRIDVADGWDTRIQIQNVGDAHTGVITLFWGDYSGQCPSDEPGIIRRCMWVPENGVWTLRQAIPDGVYSAIVYSVSGARFEAACEAAGSIDSGEAWINWEDTYAYSGEPLAVTVNRRASNGSSVSGTYNGFSETMLGPGPSYQYFALNVMHGYNGLDSTITIQNSGDDCASVWLYYKEEGNCEYVKEQHIAAIAPGEAIRIGPGPDADTPYPGTNPGDPGVAPWLGSAYITASEPLAIVVDRWDADSTMLLTHAGVPVDYGATTNYAPLFYREISGWDTQIQVQNLSESEPSFVSVDFMDSSGNEILFVGDWVCPNGTATFYLTHITDLFPEYVGMAVIESHEQVDYPGGPPGEPIASVVSLINSDSGQTLSYNALPSQQVEGVKTVVLPHVAKGQQGPISSIAIANLSNCVMSDIRLDFYDETGTINYSVCQNTLSPWDLDYVDLANYGHIAPGWVGDVVVTAVRSEDICEPGDYEPAIAAVAINRDDNGDLISGYEGSPFFDDYAPDGVTDCTPPSSGGATNYAPLFYREFSGWDTEIEVQNLSSSIPALVQVRFLDSFGDTITTMMDWIGAEPPWNTRTFVLPSTDTFPFRYVGAAVIRSQDYVNYPGSAVVPAPDISSRVTLRELDTWQVIAYDAFSLDQTLGVTEIDLPSLVKGYQGKNSEIIIRNNGERGPKFRGQIEIYDDEGTEIEQLDLPWLHARHLEVIRLEDLETIPTGFTGSGKVKVTEVEILWPGEDQPNIAAMAIEWPPTTCYDFNGDGQVDVADIMLVANCWRVTTEDPDCAPYDLNGDGIINIVDIMLVVAHWGETCG